MESKLNTTVFCFLGLFVFVQGLLVEPENWGKYEKCFTYANCLPDGTGTQKIDKCINLMKPEGVQSEFKNIEDDYKWNSNNLYDVLKEYCKLDDAKKPDAYNKSFKGIATYLKKVCADASKKDKCTGITQNMDCLFGYLDQLKQQGKC